MREIPFYSQVSEAEKKEIFASLPKHVSDWLARHTWQGIGMKCAPPYPAHVVHLSIGSCVMHVAIDVRLLAMQSVRNIDAFVLAEVMAYVEGCLMEQPPAPIKEAVEGITSDKTLRNLEGRVARHTIVFDARTKDGRVVRVTADDFGTDFPAWDSNGLAYEAAISRFSWDGKSVASAVDLTLYKMPDEGTAMRMVEDIAILEAAGLDPLSIQF